MGVFAHIGMKRGMAFRLLFESNMQHNEWQRALVHWVNHDAKQQFAAIARHQGLSESALLKRLIDLMFRTTGNGGAIIPTEVSSVGRAARLTARPRADDQRLLRERAAARGMPAATCVSVLVRSHLRGLTRLTHEERLALKESVAELSAMGRNLNQIARAANQGGRVVGPRSQAGGVSCITFFRCQRGLRRLDFLRRAAHLHVSNSRSSIVMRWSCTLTNPIRMFSGRQGNERAGTTVEYSQGDTTRMAARVRPTPSRARHRSKCDGTRRAG